MTSRQAYDNVSEQYDFEDNATRHLNQVAVRRLLKRRHFDSVVQIGCGACKNTQTFHLRNSLCCGFHRLSFRGSQQDPAGLMLNQNKVFDPQLGIESSVTVPQPAYRLLAPGQHF